MRAALVLLLLAHAASANDLCAPAAKHHGTAIDLDLVRADLHDVLRLLADTAKLDLVVGADVSGAVTLKLKQVPWDAAVCTIARLNHLRVTLDGGILLVKKT
jgi:type II secretory pathway component HofQ